MLLPLALMTLSAVAQPAGLPGMDNSGQASEFVDQAKATNGDLARDLATERNDGVRVKTASSIEDDLGFFERFVPFSVDEELHPDIDDNFATLYVVWLFAGGYGGPLWLHKVLLDDPDVVKTEDFQEDALWFWIWTMVMTVANVAFMYVGLILGPVVFITFTVGIIVLLLRLFYIVPVSYINFLNRHALANTGGGRKKKKRRKKRRESLNELPGMNRAAVASY